MIFQIQCIPLCASTVFATCRSMYEVDNNAENRLRNDLYCVEWDVKPYTIPYRSDDVVVLK